MSVPDVPPTPSRRPVLTILMAVAGVILLLPGVCAVLVIASGGEGYRVPGGRRGFDFSLIPLWLVCFLISAGGTFLLYKAFNKTVSPGLLRYILLALVAFAFLFVVGIRAIF